jgi:NADH dehydrogenase FAD-containing subunit
VSATPAARHLVLLGSSTAHVQVLLALARRRPAGLDITLVAPDERPIWPPRLAACVSGREPLDACRLPLDHLARRVGARLLTAPVSGLDADARVVTLQGEEPLVWDWLGLDTRAAPDGLEIETALPGARAHALPLHPLDDLARLWPRVLALAQSRAVHLAVVGHHKAAVELALAAAHALGRAPCQPGSHVSLVSGGGEVPAGWSPSAQKRVAQALRHRGISVLPQACTGFSEGQVHLAGGARLACDVSVLAADLRPPAWLTGSGLALDAEGQVRVNAGGQSTSHPTVFAEGPGASNGAGSAAARNLCAAVNGRSPAAHTPRLPGAELLDRGDGGAVGDGGAGLIGGRALGLWKNIRERRFLMACATEPPQR